MASINDFRTGRLVGAGLTGYNGRPVMAEVLDFTRPNGSMYYQQYVSLPKFQRQVGPSAFVSDLVTIEGRTFNVRPWDRQGLDYTNALTGQATATQLVEAAALPMQLATPVTSGCNTCRNTSLPSTVNGGQLPPRTGGTSTPQGTLTNVGPIQIPLTGTVKVCWPCVTFWLMLAYLAVSGRR